MRGTMLHEWPRMLHELRPLCGLASLVANTRLASSLQLLISPPGTDLDKDEETNFVESTIKTGGYGITDVAWRNDKEIWAVGGSNTLYSR